MHAYDNPGISSHEFMLAVMHDPTVALQIRIWAADELCRAGLDDIGTVRVLRVVIEGGMPYQPTTDEQQEVALLHRIWASGQTLTSLGYFDKPLEELTGYLLADMPVKGRA